MLTIYNYDEPVAFIKDYINGLKEKNSDFNLKEFATEIGLSSHVQIIDVLNGKRKVREKLINGLMAHAKIDKAEIMYLRAIVARSKADDEEKKRMFDLLVEELRPNHQDSEAQYSINYMSKEAAFTDCIYTIILSLSELPNFDLTVKNIQEKLVGKLDQKRVETALFDLLQSGQLRVNDEGRIEKKYLRTTNRAGLKGKDLEAYYTTVCEIARESFDLPSDQIELNMFSFPIASKNIPLAKEVILKCRNQLSKISDMDEADKIYQANLTLVPVTK